ncbi:ZIP family metal transporter [Corynebacterium guangdongense]|uniref:ZIP family zinc transporter n=1 Tax=Corynebacterium guangdongense TaxID=1783348 RepID=A0ABU1ZTT0_9CORY|nr:ZIP family zinc transporter [Corynebacterium guangdongense]MDR7328336.1 ZIP family zinc transporter [Corynebacterium guangdongense]WJZ16914.1 zinc transporter ZupT [Corynebacterium guangdongense]
MPEWLAAGAAGLMAGAALVLGSVIAWFISVPARVVAAIMAFGAGVLISALSFELVDEAMEQGGLAATAVGFLSGALIYVVCNLLLARQGARHRKRSGDQQPSASEGPGVAIAVGALIDGIPESMVLGLSFLTGGGLSLPMLAAVFISNVPEGLSSTAGMKNAGRGLGYVFGIWGGIAVLSGVASLAGYLLLDGAAATTLAFVNALAAGAILAMITDTMVPEAFEKASLYAGLIATLGFLAAFSLHSLG